MNILPSNFDQSPFEKIKHIDEQGFEFWYARELMVILGYKAWRRFNDVIQNALENLETLSVSSLEHFLPDEAKSMGRPKVDYKLSRLAVEAISSVVNKRGSRIGHVQTEQLVTKALCETMSDCKREVRTLAGNIDILTQSEIIEVKKIINWKSGVGQVLIYGHYYPSHQKRLHLFGETQESYLKMIKSHCKKLKIKVTWQP